MIKEMCWKEARTCLDTNNEELKAIIDELDPDESFTLYKISYPYGEIIQHRNQIFLPNPQNRFVPCPDDSIPPAFLENILGLSENNDSILGVVLTNTVERVFINSQNQIFSYNLFSAGWTMETHFYTDWISPFTLTAGASSVCMVPKISIAKKYKEMERELGCRLTPPQNFYQHTRVFKEIIQSPLVSKSWNTDILFFGTKWKEKMKSNDKRWGKLNNYFMKNKLIAVAFFRIRSILKLLFDKIKFLLNQRTEYPPIIFDIVDKIFLTMIGSTSGHKPFTGDESVGPFNFIQQVYIDIYGLTSQPILIVPTQVNIPNQFPVYCSLTSSPLPFVYQKKHRDSHLNILNNVANLLSNIYACIHEKQLEDILRQTLYHRPLDDIFLTKDFDFFHKNSIDTSSKLIKSTRKLFEEDDRFSYRPNTASAKKSLCFPEQGNFINACIKIKET